MIGVLMPKKLRLAQSFKVTRNAVLIDDEELPFYIAAEGPRTEPLGDGALTILWVPVIVNAICPAPGSPEDAAPVLVSDAGESTEE